MTYWLINMPFLLVVVAVAVVAVVLTRGGKRMPLPLAPLGLALAVVLVMTAVFDNIMIRVGLVGYDETRISGVFVGIAPVEDFAYAVAAVILLPSLWVILGRRPRPTAGSRVDA